MDDGQRDAAQATVADPQPLERSASTVGRSQTAFSSILFPGESRPLVPGTAEAEPPYFADLNLDQVVEPLAEAFEEYELRPHFWARLTDVDVVYYRHDVMRDMEDDAVRDLIQSFSQQMRTMRGRLTRAAHTEYLHEREAWTMAAIECYCTAVAALDQGLVGADPKSKGFRGLSQHLSDLVASDGFAALTRGAAEVRRKLSEVRYCVTVRGGKVTVRPYEDESDYSEEVLAVFDRFKQGASNSYLLEFSEKLNLNHVEARILSLVAKLFPAPFEALDAFCHEHLDYLDPLIARFDKEVQFYVAYLGLMGALGRSGLEFCYPEMSGASKDVVAEDAFDVALADMLVAKGASVVTNDLRLTGPERTIVISGPNQGGKTTLARTFGQLHHLAGVGLPVPGRSARLILFDDMFTHFGAEEDLANLSGKLEEDLVRIRDALDNATDRSIVIMNEIFSSTTLEDARVLGRRMLERIHDLDLLCVYVTFVDELSSLNESTVSMVSTVNPENPVERTFKVVRRRADGRAYAVAIAERYGLSYDRLRKRIAP